MPRFSLRNPFLLAILGLSCALSSGANPAFSDDSATTGAAQVRQQIEEQRLKKQNVDKDLTLRQGAATVASQRVQEIQKQLA